MFTLAILLMSTGGLWADLDKGLAAYDVGDYETSLSECQPLADEGNAIAQFCVGRLYANGFGVAMNDALALQWYGRAAEQGYSEALYNLGLMHANGWGVEMNDEEAAKLYRLAADQGFIEAQTSLAMLCHKGRGVEQNLTEAYMWYDIAVQLGDLNSSFKRDDVATDMSPEQVANAQQLATRWLIENGGEATSADRID
jgi:TPR repeat protein